MGLETATLISDLVPSNPGAGDLRNQGDDHLRLIKSVLQNTFPGANKAFTFPLLSNIATTSAIPTDDNVTYLVSTASGKLTLTLPVFGATHVGWHCWLWKYSGDANPMILDGGASAILSGELSGLTKTRRAIPGKPLLVQWNGLFWFVERNVQLPIGTLLPYSRASLPPGFEWPNGQTLANAATDYPDYNNLIGSGLTPDKRGRVNVTLDNLGGAAAGRLSGGIIAGSTLGAAAGTDTVSLGLSQLPTGITSTNPGGAAVSVASNRSDVLCATIHDNYTSVAGDAGPISHITGNQITSTGSIAPGAIGVTSNNTSGGAHSNMQPSYMNSEIMVVE